MKHRHPPFTDPVAVASYAQDALRRVPGMADLHRMAVLLLAEQAPGAGHILVVGAGGGLELKAMAEARRDWRFEGVDPSPAMLDLARQAALSFEDRVVLTLGTIDDASAGPFDGATCLLTLHFLDSGERLRTLLEIRRRVKPGARLVMAHHAPPQGEAVRWLARSAAFSNRDDGDREEAMTAGKVMAERLPLLTPSEEEALLREAGFIDVALFYAALSFRGWVASAGPA